MITIATFFTNNGIPQTGLTPTIKIRDVDTGNLLVNNDTMTEIGDGWYKYDFDGDESKNYAGICDGGSTLTTAERYTYFGTEINSNLYEISSNIIKILGLSQSNYRIFNPVYENENLVSGTIKIYKNSTDCNNDNNPIKTYQITAEYNSEGLMTSYKVIEL